MSQKFYIYFTFNNLYFAWKIIEWNKINKQSFINVFKIRIRTTKLWYHTHELYITAFQSWFIERRLSLMILSIIFYLTTVFFNPLEQPLKDVSIRKNSDAKTNLTTKNKVQLYNDNYIFSWRVRMEIYINFSCIIV
jgi:hypothetical protein